MFWWVGPDEVFACRGYGLVFQLFIVDAGVSLELLFSVFVGQCACLYVLDDSFRFCKYRQESCRLSTLLYAVEMTWRTLRKCNQFINVWPSLLQMKNNIIFINSEQVVRCTRSLANQTRLFVCTTNGKSTCGLEEKKERDVQCPCGRVVNVFLFANYNTAVTSLVS